MKANASVSPEIIKLVIAGAGLFGVITLWGVVQNKIDAWGYEPVYGQQNLESVTPVREELYSLPIVIAKSDTIADQTDGVNDDVIEAAFRAPEPVVDDEAEAVPTTTLGQQLFALYRPVVNGASGNGAFLNGQFWSIGEQVVAMPLRANDGGLVIPIITGISAQGVGLRMRNETVTLAFDHY